jgi:hypothetical protein
MKRFVRIAVGALAIALIPAVACRAADSGVEQARETLRRMREAREKRAAEAQPFPFDHHLKKPVIVDWKLKPEVPKPALVPSGTIKVRGALRVVVGGSTYAVGDEIVDKFRVHAITPKTLVIKRDDLIFEYPIR